SKIIWSGSVGYIDSAHTKKVNQNTLFQAGSMSKPVAALMALRLISKTNISLDAPINPYLKGWKIPKSTQYRKEVVTLRELLSMSSGLNIGGYYGYMPGDKLPTVIETLNGQKPANNMPVKMIYKPGSKYYYSGGGYEVVQLFIQSQFASDFPADARKLVFSPLNMTHSNFQQPLLSKLSNNAARATDSNGKSFVYKWRVAPEYTAGGLWTTPTDLAKFVIAVIRSYRRSPSSILTLSLVKTALTPQRNTPYGLGFVIKGSGNQLRFMKMGQNAGYQGWLVGFPNTGQGIVVMTNSDNGRKLAQDLIYAVANAYHWPTKGRLKDVWMVK
ncbi:MAG: beta-lactamase family protein, partial [Gammaproteobacteria bacterium]|nr:beta-lactamase family protein [Gammaproteobacteria bacterium]